MCKEERECGRRSDGLRVSVGLSTSAPNHSECRAIQRVSRALGTAPAFLGDKLIDVIPQRDLFIALMLRISIP